jgi:hypothetical protein
MANNDNRGRLRDSLNPPTPRPASGDPIGATSPNSITSPGILGAPMCLDPHKDARHSNDNRTVAPGAKPRSHYTNEIRRRLSPGSGDTYK